MDIEDALAVLAEQHRAVLSTLRADGTPQLTPVLVTADGDGRAVISTREGSAKVANLRRDPRAWLCALPPQFFGRWVQVAGDVEIVELPEALPLLEDYYRRISGEHPDWDAYRESMRSENRVLVRVLPTQAVAPAGS